MAKIGIKHPIGSGGGGTSIGYLASVIGEYKIDTTVGAPPASGRIRYDNATQTSATNIYIHDVSDTGVDSSIFLALLKVGAKFVIQDADDHANIQIWSVSSAPVDNTTYWTIPVTLDSSNGTGTTGFANNHRVFAAAFNPETDEKVKVSANDTTEGYLNGKLVSGSGITLTENNDGGNETLTVEVDYGDLDSVYAKLDSSNQPFTSSSVNSLNTSNRIAYDGTGLISINWGSRFLRDTFGWNSMNWESRTLTGLSNNLTLSWQAAETYDASVTKSLNWDSRDLFDSSASSVLNWESKILQRADGTDSIDWHNRTLKVGTTVTVDWANASLNTTGGVLSVDADTRELKDSGGQTFLDWENYQLPWLAGTPGLIYADNSGYLDVRPNLGGFDCTVNVATGYIVPDAVFRFRAPYNFQSSEWFVSSKSGGSVDIYVLRSALAWPSFLSDDITNGNIPQLVGSNEGTGSAAAWDPIDKDDYIVILVYTSSTDLTDFTLQVIGDKL